MSRARDCGKSCTERLLRLFPHVLLSLSLVAYAFLGAILFEHIEGGSPSSTLHHYRHFLGQIVDDVQNTSGKLALILVSGAAAENY